MSLPPPRELPAAIRSSCESVSLPLNSDAIDAFIASVDEAQWRTLSHNHGVRLPLKFDSPRQELNILAILGLLNFLSGYREPLHRLTGRGAYSTVLSLVLSAYLSSTSSNPPERDPKSILSARGMVECTVSIVASLVQIQTHRESDHPTLGPAVKVGTKDEQAFEILELLTGVLNETGRILEDVGCENLGQWIERELCRTKGHCGAMIHSLATTFPAFRDVHHLNRTDFAGGGNDDNNDHDDDDETRYVDRPVYLFKKALWTLNAIQTRFSRRETSDDHPEEEGESLPFPIPNTTGDEGGGRGGRTGFPVFADNVLPSMLIYYKILPPPPSGSNSTTGTTRAGSTTPNAIATLLRASSVYAGQKIVERAHQLSRANHNSNNDDDDDNDQNRKKRDWLKSWTEVDLDGYLWSLAKQDGNRERIERVVQERGTVYY